MDETVPWWRDPAYRQERTSLGLPKRATVAGRSSIAFLLALLGVALLWLEPSSRILPFGLLVALDAAGALAVAISALRMPGPAPKAVRIPARIGFALGLLSLLALAYSLLASGLPAIGLPQLPAMR
ncbi:hypothetical protein [Frondihabitans cladoniiphilus]|uniref:Uncharacterized protein n=1 Tax=Frondihabitans cladoniiphilus TaxID=715785 RepID=A0ABP8W9N0_9MICO